MTESTAGWTRDEHEACTMQRQGGNVRVLLAVRKSAFGFDLHSSGRCQVKRHSVCVAY